MDTKTKILLVEDDENLGNLLAEYMRAKALDVDLRQDGRSGLEAFARNDYDLVILDVMMPRMDGFSVAREIRRSDDLTPIIFLTAKNMKQDTIQGFQSGADDYMTKPFVMEELLLRVKAVLKRTKGATDGEEEPREYRLGTLVFDVRKQTLAGPEGSPRRLTTKESELLAMLCAHQNGLLERKKALRSIWGDDNYFNGRSMDVYIAKLRKYLRLEPNVEIVNIHGQGFRLVVHQAGQ
ncbi:MAG: response regulator transcription factor [Flavobacteriales bacterium]|nr:response regulator transcription factor [Flavobacteriales bacterium]